jgi:Amt family ammonium transporter
MKTVTSGRARLAGIVAGASPVLFAAPAFAQEGLDKGDTAWMLTSTLLVLMMTIPGLALFYGGMVRKKHTLAMVMQSFAIACLVTIVWMVAGYSLAFSAGGAANAVVGGLGNLFLSGLTVDAMSGSIPETVFMTFQMTFAIITPALITGSLADRMKFSTLLVFVAVWIVVVYAPITHWVWGGGFLAEDGVLDFAGGTVVHINAGVSGLVAALIVGKRHGYRREYMAPHNLVYSIIGASLLWVGWFGFNAGSAVAADNAAGMAMAVTQISAAAAGLSWMVIEWAVRGKPSVLGIVSGVVGGLVAITPAAGFVAPGGALVIGLVAGAVCFWGATWLKNKLGYDDSLDCFGVHGIGGIVGALLTGVFAIEAIGGTPGALEGNLGQVWIQIEGIVATIAWSAVATAVILLILKAVMGLRVDPEAEIEGLDLALHGETVQ